MFLLRKQYSTSIKIGFIGLGKMGGPMSNRLIANNYDVTVFDLNPSAVDAFKNKAKIATDFIAFTNCDVVFTMLPDAKSTKKVLFSNSGLINYLKKGSIIVNSGTIGILECQNIHATLKGDYEFIDAPVSGGTIGACEGSLTFMVGASLESGQKISKILMTMGKNVFSVGEVGSGQATKLCNNMLLAINMMGTSEAFALARKLNLDLNTFSKVINMSSGRSWVTEKNNPVPGISESSPASKNYKDGFSTQLLLKDIHLALLESELKKMNLRALKASEKSYSLMVKQEKDSEQKDMSYLFQYLIKHFE